MEASPASVISVWMVPWPLACSVKVAAVRAAAMPRPRPRQTPTTMVVCRKGRSRSAPVLFGDELGGGCEGRFLFCGAGGASQLVAADKQEGDRDRGQADRAA